MSWARYWATRASAPLNRRAATPLAARSWLTRLNSTPAAPPTDETGGAGGLRGAGTTRPAMAAGAAGAGAAAGAAGGGDGGASSTSLARSFTPACLARRKATLALLTRVATTEWARWDPTTAMIASVNSGMLM